MGQFALTEAVYYILLSLQSPLHGYGIIQNVDAWSKGRVKLAPGTLYGALNTLLDKKWIEALEENPESRKRITASFIWKLMQISGTACDLEYCPVCDGRYADDEVLYFSNPMGVPCCKSCSDSEYLVLLPGSRRYLRYTMPLAFSQAVEVKLNPAAEDRIFTYMLRWASVFVQSPMKTLKELLQF